MLLLLSPAKTMDPRAPELPQLRNAMSTPTWLTEATDIVTTLKTWSLTETQRQLGLSESLAMKVHTWHQAWKPESALAAGWTFRGDAFKSLDLPSVSLDIAIEAQRRLLILHGVYGMLRPLDQFMPVRLEMAQRWCHDPAFKNMAGFWRNLLPKAVDLAAQKAAPSGLILNLASAEYGEVALSGVPKERVVTCVFLERRNGQLKSISSLAKTARGAMARSVLSHKWTTPDELHGFQELGYALSPQDSTSNKKVFIRPLEA